jgi:hypothetical protein
LKYLGALNIEQWTAGIERALAFRERGNDGRFYDIDFKALQCDPFGAVGGLCEWLGEPITNAFDTWTHRWWELHASTRQPNVYPDASTFGVDLDNVRPKFAHYVSRAVHWNAAERIEDMAIDLSGGLPDSREYLFAVAPETESMRDAVNMWVSDDRGVVCLPRFAVEASMPNWNEHDQQVNVGLGDGRIYRLMEPYASMPSVDDEGRATVLGAGPLVFRCLEPFQRWTAEFRGTAVETTVEELLTGKRDGPRVDLEVEVEATMAVPPWTQGTLWTARKPLACLSVRRCETRSTGREEHVWAAILAEAGGVSSARRAGAEPFVD